MLQGIIKTVKTDRGFGFVQDDRGRDYFFHLSALPRGEIFTQALTNRPVAFEVEQTDRGPKAINIKVYEHSLPPAA